MPRVRSRNAYRYVSDIDKGPIVMYLDCGLSYRSIAARVGRDPMTVSRIWNWWVQDDKFRFCLQHQDGHIRVRRYHGERILAEYNRHRHTGPPPGVMIWGVIGYTSRSPLVCTSGTLNSACYISFVLRPAALPFIRALRNPIFQRDNARPYVAGIV
ncbi:uncharacterized protein TNCV_452251 [Trichonephila clavipes]|nr:uncharacterized protein TNCV_452251 [Trichonephila clavipes]